MTERVTVTAVYEEGVLRPMQRLNLREKQTVQIQILQEPNESLDAEEESEEEMNRILESLVEAGILTPPPGDPDVAPIPRRAMHTSLRASRGSK